MRKSNGSRNRGTRRSKEAPADTGRDVQQARNGKVGKVRRPAGAGRKVGPAEGSRLGKREKHIPRKGSAGRAGTGVTKDGTRVVGALVSFDAGVVAGSTCQEIFEEELAKHPAGEKVAAYFKDACSCAPDEKPRCFRTHLQQYLTSRFGNDTSAMTNKLNELLAADDAGEVLADEGSQAERRYRASFRLM